MKTNDALSRNREFCKRLATHDLTTVKESHAAFPCLIEKATSVEQLRAIGTAIIHGVLMSNPKMFRQLDNGNWVLRHPKGKVIPFSPNG